MPETAKKPSKPRVIINPFLIHWKNILIPLLIGTTLIGAGLVGYYYFELKWLKPPPLISFPKTATPSAQKDETADWKVYINKARGYSVKYPSSWIVENNGKATVFKSTADKSYISVSAISVAEIELSTCDINPNDQGCKPNTVVSGIPARRFSYQSSELVNFTKGGFAFAIILGEKSKDSLKVFDQFLPTFKFLD